MNRKELEDKVFKIYDKMIEIIKQVSKLQVIMTNPYITSFSDPEFEEGDAIKMNFQTEYRKSLYCRNKLNLFSDATDLIPIIPVLICRGSNKLSRIIGMIIESIWFVPSIMV